MLPVKEGKQIDENQKWLFITVEIDGVFYEYTNIAPVHLTGAELQDYAESRYNSYKFDILRDVYPDRPKLKNLKDMEQWIADGCIISAVLDKGKEIEPERVAEKVEWTNKHPVEVDLFDRKKPSKDTLDAFDKATTIAQLKKVLKRILIK